MRLDCMRTGWEFDRICFEKSIAAFLSAVAGVEEAAWLNG